jgi:hypothetical protein
MVDMPAAARLRDAERELLRVCHLSPDLDALMKDLVACFSSASGCEAVGIRLRRGYDFPYYTTGGFPERFVQSENSLCVRDIDGEPELDAAGSPVLACMCGNIICGRFDPSLPFFTANGSF